MMANDLSTSIYDGMDGAARTIAQDAAAHIAGIQRNVVTDIAEIGKTLLRVKEAVGHGSFIPWLKAEFGWTERTAQNYMSVAERLAGKYETVSHLPLTTLYALASPSTPDELRNGVVAKLEKGEPFEPGEIASELREVRREAQRKAEDEKKRERSLKGKSQQERERALAAFGRRERARLAEQERVRRDADRRTQARADAVALVVKSLSPPDLARLLELLDGGSLFVSAAELTKLASAPSEQR